MEFGEKESRSVAFAIFYGVHTPILASFKLPHDATEYRVVKRYA